MDRIDLHTEALQVIVNADQGAEILHLAGAEGINVLAVPNWKTPLPAGKSRTYGDDELDWHSEYRGGWQELFPNAGASCTVMGVPLPFHGEVSRAPWQWEWRTEGREAWMSCPTRLPLVLERTMRLDPHRLILFIEESIQNESKLTVPYIWGHHPAFGSPLAEAGARIDLPAGKVFVDDSRGVLEGDLLPGSQSHWPYAHGHEQQSIDLSLIPPAPTQRLCFAEMREGWFAIRNPQRRLGVALAWDRAAFPYTWLWQEIGASQEMPWYGRANITAIEPATQWPTHGLAEAIQSGQARTLAAGQSLKTALTCVLFAADERAVTHVALDGTLRFE